MLASFVLNAVLMTASPNGPMGGMAASNAAVNASSVAATPLLTPQFRRFGIAEGLPGGPVYTVAQDNHGLMWFGSAGGLIRYDGIDFKVFRHVADDPQSLPFNAIYTLLVDRDNRIWAGGISGGLARYDPSNGHFRHWEHDDGQPASLSGNEVWNIVQTADGALWLATQAGLDRMRPDGSGFDHVPLQVDVTHAASFGPVRALLAERDGRLWIGAQSGLYLRQADGRMQRVPVAPAYHGDLSKIWAIEGGNGEVRIALDGGLLEIGADGVARPLLKQSLSSEKPAGSRSTPAVDACSRSTATRCCREGCPAAKSGVPRWIARADSGSPSRNPALPTCHRAGTASPVSPIFRTIPAACPRSPRRRYGSAMMAACGWVATKAGSTSSKCGPVTCST
jgi:streptogramin lyase